MTCDSGSDVHAPNVSARLAAASAANEWNNRLWLALLLATACSSTDALDPDAAPMPEGDLPIDPRLQPLADQIEAERAELGAPGVAVLVMENGRIVEDGPPEQLIVDAGRFAGLHQAWLDSLS